MTSNPKANGHNTSESPMKDQENSRDPLTTNSIKHNYQNNAKPKHFLCIKRRNKRWQDMPDRELYPLVQDLTLPNNQIQTAKYNAISFLPINLVEQFTQLANVYFLIITGLQTVQEISISGGQPVMGIPLLVVVLVSAIKSLFEDLRRHKSDNQENNREVFVWRGNGFVSDKWRNLRVGDIVKAERNKMIPADMILLYSSDPKGTAYVETKNLDGETNLKIKFINKDLQKYFANPTNVIVDPFILSQISGSSFLHFNYERPTPYLYNFKGSFKGIGEGGSMDYANFALRGSSLKNTDFVYGLVAYTGHETKIMLNSVKAQPKKSTAEKAMSKQVIYIFIMQCLYCSFASIYYNIWLRQNEKSVDYLNLSSSLSNSNFVNFIVRLGNWILIFTNFVPISMLVTLELVRLFQAILMMTDKKMKTDDIYAVVQSSNLNEELGQIEYLFSDKTGTLTKNQMVFKKLSINGVIYGENRTNVNKGASGYIDVDFGDQNFFDLIEKNRNQYNALPNEFLISMAIAHTVMVEVHDGKSGYSVSSPDELALINFAKMAGFTFEGTDENNILRISNNGNILQYQVLHTLEFNSARKRMSVIVKDNNNQIILYTKGADSIIYARLKKGLPYLKETEANLTSFGNEGLRTLVYAKKAISASEYADWSKRYLTASMAIEDREAKMEALQEEVETNLEMIGATAVDDKLQDEVSETIDFLIKTDIKVWVLTGDKVDTARSIGRSCKLISKDMHELKIDSHDFEHLIEQVKSCLKTCHEQPDRDYYLIITGDSLICIQKKHTPDELTELTKIVKTVLACRVSPKQKQEIVELVRRTRVCRCLSIGDGANDVNMINAANVGIGIRGKEGLQVVYFDSINSKAARASDFSIGEFKHLRRLMYYYGRECYRRNTHVIRYNFFKNMILVLPQFWFGFFGAFSGQTLYDSFLYQFFNLFYASLPIIIYAVFDEEEIDEVMVSNPRYYDLGKKNQIFGPFAFWSWIFSGAVQSIPISVFTFLIMSQGPIKQSGYTSDLWTAGTIGFTLSVLVANFKILLLSYKYNAALILSIFFSFLTYFASVAALDVVKTSNLYQQLTFPQASGSYYLNLFEVIVCTTFIDLALQRFSSISRREALHELDKKVGHNDHQLMVTNYSP